MRKHGFTLIELLVVVIIIGIVATLGIPAYKNTIEDAKAKVCKVNLEALQLALDVYAMEHDVMPASLSQLPGNYIEQAYNHILERKGAWKIELAYFIVDWEKRDFAYAAFLKDDLAKGNMKILTCPTDLNPDSVHGSYGINSIILTDVNGDGKAGTSADYQAIPKDTVLIGDCSAAAFADYSQLNKRHKHFTAFSREIFAQTTNKSNQVCKFSDAGMIAPTSGSR